MFLQATTDNARDWHNALIADEVVIVCRPLTNS